MASQHICSGRIRTHFHGVNINLQLPVGCLKAGLTHVASMEIFAVERFTQPFMASIKTCNDR